MLSHERVARVLLLYRLLSGVFVFFFSYRRSNTNTTSPRCKCTRISLLCFSRAAQPQALYAGTSALNRMCSYLLIFPPLCVCLCRVIYDALHQPSLFLVGGASAGFVCWDLRTELYVFMFALVCLCACMTLFNSLCFFVFFWLAVRLCLLCEKKV